MNNKNLLLTLGAIATAASLNAAPRPEKPNVLFLLVDDLGWQDLVCYDIDEPSLFETPNLDALAKQGVMFWQAYSPAPTSAPSRGAMLSGKHPARLQRTHVVGGSPVVPHAPLSSMMPPWYSGHLSTEEITIPELIKKQGYVSGHIGKWHIAINHSAPPQPLDHGFDYTKAHLGQTRRMLPDRLSNFATSDASDPYQLDENGFPKDQTNIDAIEFIKGNKHKPFFLYYATWLVHSPIHIRAKALLDKYVEKLGVPYPTDPKGWNVPGQKNPYYAAMVESLDYYAGQVFDYLRTTDDPRWKGHKLIENTYIIFTSDNGGMEGVPNEIITDNYPLDRGKINAEEGGIRVPFIVVGPGIAKGIESDVMINGLDIFPTIMSWTKTPMPKDLKLDGADLSNLLKQNPKDASLVKLQNGEVRNTIMHHFPHSRFQSSIREDGFKLIRNYTGIGEKYQLFELYNQKGKRKDIEEKVDLAAQMPEKVKDMNDKLSEILTEMNASYPYKAPKAKMYQAQVNKFVKMGESKANGQNVELTFTDDGYKIVKAFISYTLNGGETYEEWYVMDAKLSQGKVTASLPKGTTHYIFGLVDEKNFWFNYPDMKANIQYPKGIYSGDALKCR